MESEGAWTFRGSKKRRSHMYQEKRGFKERVLSIDGVQDRLP